MAMDYTLESSIHQISMMPMLAMVHNRHHMRRRIVHRMVSMSHMSPYHHWLVARSPDMTLVDIFDSLAHRSYMMWMYQQVHKHSNMIESRMYRKQWWHRMYPTYHLIHHHRSVPIWYNVPGYTIAWYMYRMSMNSMLPIIHNQSDIRLNIPVDVSKLNHKYV